MDAPFEVDLRRLHDGDRAYFGLLVRAYGPQVDAIVFSYAQGDFADDLRQRSWIRVYEKRRSFTGRGDFGAWIHRVVHNVCVQALRKRKRRAEKYEEYEELLDPRAPSRPDEEFDRHEFRSSLMRALGQLPKRQQEAFYLTQVKEYSVNEAAEMMGTQPATVRSNLRHAVEKLRELLKEYE